MALCERARSEPASASDARDAIDQARTALVTSDEQGLRLVRAMAIEAIGCALIRLGHGPKGIAQLHNAAVAMEKLGARVDLARALLRAARAQYASGTHASVAAAGATLDRARKLIEEVGLDGERATASSLQAMLV
jgi:hypothetical protein